MKSITVIVTFSLVLAGILLLGQQQLETDTPLQQSLSDAKSAPLGAEKLSKNATSSDGLLSAPSPSSNKQAPSISLVDQVNSALKNRHDRRAINLFNNEYGNLSSEQADEVEEVIFSSMRARYSKQDYQAVISLSEAYSQYFSDPEIDLWAGLSHGALGNYHKAIEHLSQSYANEYREHQQEKTIEAILALSDEFKQSLSSSNKSSEIVSLYAQLYSQFPNQAIFTLEYAKALVASKDYSTAQSLLSTLDYQAEFRQQAQALLDQINNALSPPGASPDNISPNQVALLKAGNSYLAMTLINGVPAKLLLDTGASITAISNELAKQLKLEVLPREILLNTANGQYRASLYRARSIALGENKVSNMIVAGIELAPGSGFIGLLGTDWLNQFSYSINGSTNTLSLDKR